MLYHLIVLLYIVQVLHYVTSDVKYKDNNPIIYSSVIMFVSTVLEVLV